MNNLEQLINPDPKRIMRESVKRIKDCRRQLIRSHLDEEEIEERMKKKKEEERQKRKAKLSSKNLKARKIVKELIRDQMSIKQLAQIKKISINFKIPKKIRTHSEFVRHIMTRNLFPLVFQNLHDVPERKSFPCCLIEGHRAWIDKDKNGYYRYFSKREDDVGRSISMSIFDFIQIVDGKFDFLYARNEIAILINAKYHDFLWEKQQQQNIEYNLTLINEFPNLARREYPSLHRLCKTHYPLLEWLHQFSIPHIAIKTSFEKRPVFYVSCQFLGEKYQKDPSVVNKVCNLFSTVGLIRKERPDSIDFPASLLHKALYYKGTIEKHKLLNFYSIPKYTKKLLKQAEEMAKILLNNGVTNYELVSERSVIGVFGEEFGKTIYCQRDLDTKFMYQRIHFNYEKGRTAPTFQSRRRPIKEGRIEEGDDPIPF